MNKKITISELSQLLSTNVSLINKKGWEDFLRIFFAQISEGLQADGNVKIKGLGTFKVVKVDARKSKDVNTGANTIIPAHNKISFTPDSSLAETLNKPYAHFEPTYVLAPEGDVDAPEPEEDDDTEVNNVKAETTETATSVETVVEEPAVAATISNLNTEVVNQAANEIETVVSETITTAETPIAETVVESQNTVAEPVETIIREEQKVETEQTSTIGYTATSSINEEIHTEEPTTTVENAATSSINEEIHTEEPTAIVENAATSSINEKIHTEEPTATVETATSSKVDDIEAEGPEEPNEEDTTADEDENVDTNPAEIAAYASTFKRHDLPKEDDDDENNDKNSHGKKLGIAIILFLCILFVVGLVAWMSDPNIVSKIRSKLTGEEPVKTEVKIDSVDYEETKDLEDQIIAEKTEENAETMDSLTESTTPIEEKETEAKPAAKQDVQKYTNFKDDFINYMKKKHPEMDITDQGDPIEEKLGNASRLTLVSLRHYGAKDFWVYIYLYNKDVIKNPNHIKAGTKIKVPMLDNTKLVNPDSEHSILTAKEIQHEFVK
ncbi:MAG: HU family DNA-binding protein [Paludibacteraceae bacterium]|nr:HU family DNA-binding protein [Paludibacteraceae bacterium]